MSNSINDADYFNNLLDNQVDGEYKVFLQEQLAYTNRKLDELYLEVGTNKKLLFVAAGVSNFLSITSHVPSTQNQYDVIKFYMDSSKRHIFDTIKQSGSSPNLIYQKLGENFIDIYIEHVLSTSSIEVTVDQFWILMTKIPNELNEKEKGLFIGEYLIAVFYYAVYLETRND